MDRYSNSIHLHEHRAINTSGLRHTKTGRNYLIYEYIKNGGKQVDAARMFKLSKSRIMEILAVHFSEFYKTIKNTQYNGLKRKYIKRDSRILLLYKNGFSCKYMAEKFGFKGVGRLYQIIKRGIAEEQR